MFGDMNLPVGITGLHFLGHILSYKDEGMADVVVMTTLRSRCWARTVKSVIDLLASTAIDGCSILQIIANRDDCHQHAGDYVVGKVVQVKQGFVLGVAIVDGYGAKFLGLAASVITQRGKSRYAAWRAWGLDGAVIVAHDAGWMVLGPLRPLARTRRAHPSEARHRGMSPLTSLIRQFMGGVVSDRSSGTRMGVATETIRQWRASGGRTTARPAAARFTVHG